jgi:lipoic acid synthetase
VVYNHNLETVPRLYRRVRPKAKYLQSLELLRRVKELDPSMTTKSGLMVGLGETLPELEQTVRDLRDNGCDLLTIGQYLTPGAKYLPVERYYHPDEFAQLKAMADALGFRHIESGPLVRSSYHAGRQARAASAASSDDRHA